MQVKFDILFGEFFFFAADRWGLHGTFSSEQRAVERFRGGTQQHVPKKYNHIRANILTMLFVNQQCQTVNSTRVVSPPGVKSHNKYSSYLSPQLHNFIAIPGVYLFRNPSLCKSLAQRAIKAPRRRKLSQDIVIYDYRLKSPVS